MQLGGNAINSSSMKCRILAFALFVSAGTLTAQETKKRMVFSNPTQTPAREADTQLPQVPVAMLERFFALLSAGKLDQAYENLAKIIHIPGRPESAKEFKERTQAAIDNFGPVTGYEVVDSMALGKSLFRQTCVSLNEDSPLRWRFYFYRTGTDWKLIDLRVDDGIVDLFEEVSRSRRR